MTVVAQKQNHGCDVQKKRIALVLPYFGRLPTYFNYFLRSLCGLEMDVLFFSDLKVDDAPSNFRTIKMTFEDLRMLANEKLQADINLIKPYKLCDLKPMYGKIFEDYLGDYDFWVFGDCDVIYGLKFNELLNRIVSEDHDVFNLQAQWISGPFCAIKNSAKCRELYARANNLKDVYSNAEYIGYDELGGYWFHEILRGEMSIADCAKVSDCFSAVVWRSDDIDFEHANYLCEDHLWNAVVRCRRQRVYLNNDEVYAFHMNNVKFQRRFICKPKPMDDISDYDIHQIGFVASDLRGFRLRWVEFQRTGWARLQNLLAVYEKHGSAAVGRMVLRKIMGLGKG